MNEAVLLTEPNEFMDNGRQVVFKAEDKVITKYLLLLTIFIFAFSLITFIKINTTVLLVLAVVGYYIGNLFFGKRPVEIVVNLESRLLTVKSSQLLILNSVVSYPLELINYSYKLEVRARGVRGEVFRLYNKDKCIADILPEYSGWSKRTLNELYQVLCDNIPDNLVKQQV